MGVKTYRPDDTEFAAYIAGSAARTVDVQSTPPPPYHPRFGDYLAGKMDPAAAEEKTMTIVRAEADEVETLPDGRQIQIKAKGAPVVEKLVERERDLVRRAHEEAATVDHLGEIQPDPGTRALGITGNEKIVDHKGGLGPVESTTVSPSTTAARPRTDAPAPTTTTRK